MHSDHTAGFADFILTPWVLERNEKMSIFGPTGIQHMYDCLVDAYEEDIRFRIDGFEKANQLGYLADIHEIHNSYIYQDENVKVEAFVASHGTLECYGYKFYTLDRTIVISGDTCPLEKMKEIAKDADLLIHEVCYAEG